MLHQHVIGVVQGKPELRTDLVQATLVREDGDVAIEARAAYVLNKR